MKRGLALLASLAVLACARADLVIEQKIENADQTASMSTLKMKGTKLRVDMRNATGTISTIVDLETGESLTLMHTAKLALKMSAAETKETLGALRKRAGAGGNLEPVKTVTTGRKEKVGDWNAEVFTSKGGSGARTSWDRTPKAKRSIRWLRRRLRDRPAVCSMAAVGSTARATAVRRSAARTGLPTGTAASDTRDDGR